ncbi:MAG: hypothetical protein COA92_06020 [Sulfurovum sp.]|nr:MAG: hypothetical protein COA92_06020 [Sulfurovum sp.]
MKILFWILIGLSLNFTYASTLTLHKLLLSADEHNVMSKSFDQQALAMRAQSLSDTSDNPFGLYLEGSRARPKFGTDGYEYAIGISKNIKLGNIQSQERTIANLQTEASRIESEKVLIDFRNGLKNLYHTHCLDVQNYRNIKQSYNDLLILYKKKEKAYKYQEVSKVELMQLENEKNRLLAQVKKMKMMQDISKQKILMLSRIGYGNNTNLSCKDVYPIRSKIKLDHSFSLSKEAKEKRLQSAKKSLIRYDNALESVTINGQYGKELDVDRYTIGISLPLNFTSERNEHARAAAMHKASAIEYGFEQAMLEKTSLLKEFKAQLYSQALIIQSLSKNYRNYKKKLLPLIKKSYSLGETSVIEYLLNRQQLYTLSQELHTHKKAYYNTLFRLYSLSEKKD